jgi:hypothetical protein
MDFIHMNGRVYDPSIGRFLSADPNIQALYNTQSYNRYSYVLNNPLKYSDPSGFLSVNLTFNSGFIDSLNRYAKAALVAPFINLPPPSSSITPPDIATMVVRPANPPVCLIYPFAIEPIIPITNPSAKFPSDIRLDAPPRILAGRTTIVAISGGVIEELGGGKFINGATSAAFAYLFSESIKPELKVKFSTPGYEANDSVYDSAEEAYNAGAESPTASTRVRKQLIIYSQTAVGNRVMSQRGTLTIYPDYNGKPSQ